MCGLVSPQVASCHSIVHCWWERKLSYLTHLHPHRGPVALSIRAGTGWNNNGAWWDEVGVHANWGAHALEEKRKQTHSKIQNNR